jgi:lipopolysaccharide transport system permease protein
MTRGLQQAVSRPSGDAAMPTVDIIIAPRHGWAPFDLRELWQARELLGFLVWRSLKIRYKQTALGAAWAVIQPVLIMVVFTLVFGRLAGLASDGSPYALFCLTALVPWIYFSNAVSQASTSLVENERLVTKIYFPRLLIPLAVVLAGLLDLAISLVVLLLVAAGYGELPPVEIAVLPLLAALVAVVAFGVALWLSALNVYYRDVRYVITFLIQFWLFVTPVAYSSSLVPDSLLPLYAVNPMVGVIDGFRWAVLDSAPTPVVTLPLSILSAMVVLVGGLYYFRRVEDSFADVV